RLAASADSPGPSSATERITSPAATSTFPRTGVPTPVWTRQLPAGLRTQPRPLTPHRENHLPGGDLHLHADGRSHTRVDPDVVEEVVHHLPELPFVTVDDRRSADLNFDETLALDSPRT